MTREQALLQAVEAGRDALTHALYLLDDDCNQRLGMEGALRKLEEAAALRAKLKEDGE
jgi:hypothetical protein